MTEADVDIVVRSPLQGTVESIVVATGSSVGVGATLLVVESMKMLHDVMSPEAGVVVAVLVEPGTTVQRGDPLVHVQPGVSGPATAPTGGDVRVERPEGANLDEVVERHARGLDERRTDAVAKRHARGYRTARRT